MPGASIQAEIRHLTIADIPGLMSLSRLAGWNQTTADWMLLLQLQPEGCLAIEMEGQVVATATLICYGTRLAWLGMVLTHPEYRRRGFARRLVQAALRIAAARGMLTVKLDATEGGLPLYESLGFEREQPIERWSGRGRPGPEVIRRAPVGLLNFSLDAEAFAADRTRLLRMLAAAAPPVLAQDGFAMFRAGAHAAYLGPCVARSIKSARLLMASCLSASEGEWFWDLLPSNSAAVQLARDYDFKLARTLVRMRIGQDIRGEESMVYAAGGFELG